MSGLGYVAIQSWHIVETWTRQTGVVLTRCGRRSRGDVVDSLPLNGKSCETCLRLARKDEEVA